MASPNPERDKSHDKTDAIDQTRQTQHAQSTRDTQSLRSQVSDGNSDHPDCKCHQTAERFAVAKLLLSIVLTVATMGAFAAAAIYAYFAHQQVEAIKESNRLTQVNAIASDRPWVGPSALSIGQVTVDQTPKVTLGIKNYGKSPAISSTCRLGGFFVKTEPSAATIASMLRMFENSKIGTIFPNETINADVPIIGAFSAGHIKQLNEHGMYFIAAAQLTYKDSGGEVLHHTWFYATYEPDKPIMTIRRGLDLPPDD